MIRQRRAEGVDKKYPQPATAAIATFGDAHYNGSIDSAAFVPEICNFLQIQAALNCFRE